jgi:hemoglobin
MRFLRFCALAAGLLFAMFFQGCASTPEATLYDQLGGKAGVAKLVDKLVEKYRADQRINGLFNGTNFEYFAERLNEDICVRAGGGCTYQGLSMPEAHSGMDIKESEFNYFVEDTQKAMDELAIPLATQNQLLKLLARERADVIHQ